MVNKWKDDNVKTIEKESSHLDDLNVHQKKMAESSGRLLRQATNPEFITQSDDFLSNIQFPDLPPVPVAS